MARIKHIALATQDPAKTAEFLQRGLRIAGVAPDAKGFGGRRCLAVRRLHFLCDPQIRKRGRSHLGEGPSTLEGVHHIGFYVDDLDESVASFEAANGTECPGSSRVNRKYKGPDGLMIDMVERGWDEQIKARTQLLRAVPASEVPVSAD